MTLHSAKGLEFPEVYMIGMEKGLLPHHRAVTEGGDAIEEERRLCYVGVTRARERLTLSLALSRMKWGKSRPTEPSQFLYELTGQTPGAKAAAGKNGAAKSGQRELAAPVRRGAAGHVDRDSVADAGATERRDSSCLIHQARPASLAPRRGNLLLSAPSSARALHSRSASGLGGKIAAARQRNPRSCHALRSTYCRAVPFRSHKKRRRLTVETLEARNMLSASPLVATPMFTVLAASPIAASAAAVTNPTVVGYTPSQIEAAYGFNQLTAFSTGAGSEPANGQGQTIAIVDAYNDPNIASDLAVFDSAFGIAAPPSFKIVSQTGSTTKLPATNPDWDTEISLDVEWAHAIAPGANILLVETTSDRWRI